MNAPRRPRRYFLIPGSLAQRVVDWFRENPLEELTAGDIAIKFGVAVPGGVCSQLAGAVRAGLLVRATQRPAIFRLPTAAERAIAVAAACAAEETAPKPPVDVAAALRTARKLVQLLEQAQENAR